MIEFLLQLADRDVHEIAAAFQAHRLAAPITAANMQRFVADCIAAPVAGELQGLIDKGYTAAQLALVLDMLLRDRARRPPVEQLIDLVTTGPEASGVTCRDTSVVVRELFAHAQRSVLVAGYAVYQGQQVFRALADRMQELPQLNVRMFLDVQRGAGDTSTASELVHRFGYRFRSQQWPLDHPLPQLYYDPRSLELDADKRACLHAKCVVVDDEAVFVSSANFTEAAQERNIEVGLLVKSCRLAEQVVLHFDTLLAANLLAPMQPSSTAM